MKRKRHLHSFFLLLFILFSFTSSNMNHTSNTWHLSSFISKDNFSSIEGDLIIKNDSNQEENKDQNEEEKENEKEDKEEIKVDRTYSIYINPSVQTWNSYANGLGSEAEHMHAIAEIMVAELAQYPFFEVEANLKGLSLSNSLKESNQKKRDIHLALHSNAGGGTGIETYQKREDGFGKHMHSSLAANLPFPSRGLKDGNHLYEIKTSKAEHVVLMEILFHDQEKEAAYIASHHAYIAQKLVEALVSYVQK